MCHETEETVTSSILQNEEWIVQNSWSILWKYFGWSFNCTLKLSGLYLIVKSVEKLPIMSLLIIYFCEFKFVLDLGSHWSVRTGRICQVDPTLPCHVPPSRERYLCTGFSKFLQFFDVILVEWARAWTVINGCEWLLILLLIFSK